MPLDRRAVLAGVAAAAGALAGCSGDGPDQTPREVPPPSEETIGGDQGGLGGGNDEVLGGDGEPPDEARESFHYVFTPDIRGWRSENTSDGRLRLHVDMKNVDPAPVEGKIQAELRVDGSLKRYNASFTLAGNESRTVNVTYPVPYDTLREGGYLRLRVPVVNQTGL